MHELIARKSQMTTPLQRIANSWPMALIALPGALMASSHSVSVSAPVLPAVWAVAHTDPVSVQSFSALGDEPELKKAAPNAKSIVAPADGLSSTASQHEAVVLPNARSVGAIINGDAAPVVSSVSVPASGTYLIGQALEFEITASDSLVVNTSSGIPRLVLTIGSATRYASYINGSGTNSLLFRYTIVQGDRDTAGIKIGPAIELNGGTILDGAGIPLNAELNVVGSTAQVLVGVDAPTEITLSPASVNQSAVDGALVGTLKAQAPAGDTGLSFSLVAGEGDTDNGAFTITGASLQVNHPADLSAGTYTVRVEVKDSQGATFESVLAIKVIDDIPPRISLSSDAASLSAGETALVTFTLSEASSGDVFERSDISVTGGQLSDLSGSGTVFTAVFTPTPHSKATASIQVAAAAFTDAAGNASLAAAPLSIKVDTLVAQPPAGQVVPVPAVSALSAVVGSMMLSCLGVARLRRKKKTAASGMH